MPYPPVTTPIATFLVCAGMALSMLQSAPPVPGTRSPTVTPPAPTEPPPPPATSRPLAPPLGIPATPNATPQDGAAESDAVGPVRPQLVWIFVDRWKEFGGWITAETDNEISVCDGTETRTFGKAQVQDIIRLVRPKPGQRGVVQLRDGSVVRGVIVRDDLVGVGFKVDTLNGKLPRSQVYRVVLQPDFEERYAAIKANTFPEQHGRRLSLAQWLVDEQRLDMALLELEALVRDSDSDAARDLLKSVRARIKLAETVAADKAREAEATRAAADKPAAGSSTQAKPAIAAQPTDKPATDDPAIEPTTEPVSSDDPTPGPTDPLPPKSPTSAGPPNPREMLPKDLLSDEDVNLIRVYEIDAKDPPRVRVQPEGIRQLLLRYGSSSLIPAGTQERNELFGKEGAQIAQLMFDLKARDLYKYIEVQEDPASLARFRTRVHNSWMIPNCATSRCHGGVQAGKFFLYTGKAKDARIRYTNMITLLNFEVDGKRMVDFETPADSLLIQYAMPRNMARNPHPDVKGWKPVFSQGTPQLLQDTVEWIRGMYQPRPEYPIQYKAPKLNAPDSAARPIDTPDR